VVVDSGALLALVLPDTEERTGYAKALVRATLAGAVELVLPQVCHLELAAVTARRMRSGDVTSARVQEFFESIDELGSVVYLESFHFSEMFAMAVRYGCQVADAVYLNLAEELGVSVATLDGGMRQVAKQARIGVWLP
jgi:predicted nucleic acid-binding protein